MPAAFDRCVRRVRAKGNARNPYAVCRGSMGTDKQIRQRHKSKKGKRNAKS